MIHHPHGVLLRMRVLLAVVGLVRLLRRWVLWGLQVEEHCCKLARKGLTPSQIGVILRDSHGIAQVGSVTGSKVLRILKGKGALLPPLSAFHRA